MSTHFEIVKPLDLNDEFPGLDAISRKVFDVSYADATPNLREHVRIISKRDAADVMYEKLNSVLPFMPCTCPTYTQTHQDSCPREQVMEAIRLAEGRKVSVLKSAS